MARRRDRSPRGEAADDTAERAEAEESGPARPRPELRWVQLREPRHAVELGRNGRVLASHYHAGYDAWEVLLETYEGELSE
ncbi:hypothetical protein [Halorussus sp. AFM4]|uniref:hypothetical protein n=1 Tax=Halorussus sp. AFM4 TaxID=3421651 RepID=UPI003EBEE26A